MLAYLDETGEALAGQLRAGNAGANTAADQIAVAERALVQIPVEHVTDIDVSLRVDSAGASHELLDWCREGRIRYSVGYDLTEAVRAAIVALKEESWCAALDQDGSERDNGQVAEATHLLDLSGWPEGSRMLVRRERPHPGAQLSFTDHDGHRFQAILTDQPDPDIALLERQHRARARVEDRIRNDKDTGLANLPFRDFAHNEVWLALVLLAHNLIAWTQALAHRRARGLRAQAAALPRPARRRPARLLRPPGQTATRGQLGLGRRSRRRVRHAQSAPRARRLTQPHHQHQPPPPSAADPAKPARTPPDRAGHQRPTGHQSTPALPRPTTHSHKPPPKLTANRLLQDPG